MVGIPENLGLLTSCLGPWAEGCQMWSHRLGFGMARLEPCSAIFWLVAPSKSLHLSGHRFSFCSRGTVTPVREVLLVKNSGRKQLESGSSCSPQEGTVPTCL